MQKSDTIGELAKALAKAQAGVRPAIKDKENPAFRKKYADLGAVWDACRGALTDNGLTVIQMPEASEPGFVALTTMLLHSSGEFITSTATAPLAKNDPQGVGSALTYLRRYALSAVVGIVADDDDDGNAASPAPQQPQRANYAPARQEAPKPTNGAAPKPAAGGPPATDKQRKMIYAVGKQFFTDESLKAEMQRRYNVQTSAELSSLQASDFIDYLQAYDKMPTAEEEFAAIDA